MIGGKCVGSSGRGVALLCAVATCALGLIPATAAAEDPAYGVAVTSKLARADLSKMASGGVEVVRLEVSWKRTQGKGASLDWRRTDRLVRLAAERNVSIVPYLSGKPSWVKQCRRKRACRAQGDPSPDTDGWLRFVDGAVGRYGPGGVFWSANPDLPSRPITTWQIWDAVNLSAGGATSPRRYGKLLDPTYRAIKLADPDAEVLTGALSFGRRSERSMKPTTFLNKLLKTGARYSLSGLAVRPAAGTVGRLKSQLRSVRETLAKRGQPNLGIWITPIGWASDRRSSKEMSVGIAGQKRRLKQAFKALRSGLGVDGVFWTRWRDGDDACRWCRHSGLATRAGKTKPAWSAFKRFLGRIGTPPPPPPPDDPDRTFFGVIPESNRLSPGDLAYMDAANVGAVRLIVHWQAIQPTPGGPLDWSRIDRELEDLALRGIVPLPQLFGDKTVITEVSNQQTMNRWRSFVAAAVNRYKAGSPFWAQFEADHPEATPMPPHIWQIYNEQNILEFWPDGPSPNKYAVLLDASAEAIRAADPTAEIMLGGMHGDDNMNGIPSWTFLKLLYEYPGASDDFDIVAVHPYAFDLEGIEREIGMVRDVMKTKGDAEAPIWVTEMGWSSELDPNKDQWWERTPQGQADMLTSAWNLLLANRDAWNLQGVFWYTWRDPTSDLCNFCKSAGLLEENFVPKPSYSAFSELAHAGVPD